MQKIAILLITLISIKATAQYEKTRLDSLYTGKLIDKTITSNLMLYTNYYPYYYEFNAKYPQSSQTLLASFEKFFDKKKLNLKGNGYITFKFMIDNEGEMNYVKFLEIDENYNPKKFNKKGIISLYEYLKTLNKWKKVRYNGDEKTPISYISFISFKIENAKIINIIP